MMEQEEEVTPLLDIFPGEAISTGESRVFQMALMVNIAKFMPKRQRSLRPDRSVGMGPEILGDQEWLSLALGQPIRDGSMVCVNEVHEFRSTTGKLTKAVSSASLLSYS